MARAYMKSEMPYHGVPAPEVKNICKTVFPDHPFSSQAEWHNAMLDLWRLAEFREERYVAQNLAAVRLYRPYQGPKTISVYREMVIDGAWWDLVDGIVNRFGEMLLDYPASTRKKMVSWSKVRNLWQRRISILCQLKLKEHTDEDLLFNAIEVNMNDKEFFIRKAIGWSLRNYSRTRPKTVIRFVKKNRNQLSPLSKREALKVLLKNGQVQSVP